MNHHDRLAAAITASLTKRNKRGLEPAAKEWLAHYTHSNAEQRAGVTPTEIHRSAQSGRFVTGQYTDQHPDVTVTETIAAIAEVDELWRCLATDQAKQRCAFHRRHTGDHANRLGNSFTTT